MGAAGSAGVSGSAGAAGRWLGRAQPQDRAGDAVVITVGWLGLAQPQDRTGDSVAVAGRWFGAVLGVAGTTLRASKPAAKKATPKKTKQKYFMISDAEGFKELVVWFIKIELI